MHILNYNDFAASLFKCDEWDGGGFDYYGPRAAIPKYAKTTNNQTQITMKQRSITKETKKHINKL